MLQLEHNIQVYVYSQVFPVAIAASMTMKKEARERKAQQCPVSWDIDFLFQRLCSFSHSLTCFLPYVPMPFRLEGGTRYMVQWCFGKTVSHVCVW